jgi:hypothetical protein
MRKKDAPIHFVVRSVKCPPDIWFYFVKLHSLILLWDFRGMGLAIPARFHSGTMTSAGRWSFSGQRLLTSPIYRLAIMEISSGKCIFFRSISAGSTK